jgi:hypothetical protein
MRVGYPYVAVMTRSRSRAGVLVLLPHLSSTSYLSCIVDTSCKQTLLLALSEVRTSSTTHQNNTHYFLLHCILNCNSYEPGFRLDSSLTHLQQLGTYNRDHTKPPTN